MHLLYYLVPECLLIVFVMEVRGGVCIFVCVCKCDDDLFVVVYAAHLSYAFDTLQVPLFLTPLPLLYIIHMVMLMVCIDVVCGSMLSIVILDSCVCSNAYSSSDSSSALVSQSMNGLA